MKSKLDWALETQKLGLPVFPVTWTREDGSCSCGDPVCTKPGKHPLPGSKGFKDATSDPEVARRMWAANPEANIAAYPGKEYVVIDLDCKRLPNGHEIVGLTNLASHLGVDDYELLGQTYTVSTPSGGHHLYFRADHEYASGVGLIPGVDSRAVGGYVLAPGSAIHDRSYRISNPVDMEPIPDSFSKFLRRIRDKTEDAHKPLFDLDHPASIERMRTILRERAPAFQGDGGNNHTYVTIQLVKDHAISAQRCLALLLEPGGWNERCVPQWKPAELAQIIENAYAYGKDRPGSKGGSLLDMFDSTDAHDVADSIGDENDPFAKFRANFFNAQEFKDLKLEYDMIVPGWIPAMGFTCFLAARGAGKTTILMDICCRLACDMDWDGLEMDKGWDICWISGEDDPGTQIRMRAWEKKHGREVNADRFHILTMPININDKPEIESFAKFLRQETKGRRVIHVLDTWQRMTSTAESQSNDAEMQLAIYHVESLAKSFNGPAFIAFHPPKANPHTIMGSSIIENSSQAIIQITDDGNNRHNAAVTRIKGEGTGNYLQFQFEKTEIDKIDRFGKPVTSVVAIQIAGKHREPHESLKLEDRALAETILDIFDHIGSIAPGQNHSALDREFIAETILSIPQRAADGEVPFPQMAKRLQEVNWHWGNQPTKTSNSYPYGRIADLLKGKTKDYPLDLGKFGLWEATAGRKKMVLIREMTGSGEIGGISDIDDPTEVEERTDA